MQPTSTPTPTDLDGLMTYIGGAISDTPTAWIAVAMECLDQAGLSAIQQERVAEALRAMLGPSYPEGDYP